MDVLRMVKYPFNIIKRAYFRCKKDGLKTTLSMILEYIGINTTKAIHIFLLIISFFVPEKSSIWTFSSRYGFSENSKYLFLYVSNSEINVSPIWIAKNKQVASMLRQNGYKSYYMWSIKGIICQLRSHFSFFTHGTNSPQLWGAYYHSSIRIYLNHASSHIVGLSPDMHNSDSWITDLKYDYNYMLIPGTNKQQEIYNKYQPHWYTGNDLLGLGFPKNDVLFQRKIDDDLGSDKELIDQIEKQSENDKIVFYMPTQVRPNQSPKIDNPLIDNISKLKRMDEFLYNNNLRMYIKVHPKDQTPEYNMNRFGNIHILSSNIDMYPLLYSADIFISDYSSAIIDMLLLDIPIIHFVYDLMEQGPMDEFDKFGYTRRGGFCVDQSEVRFGPIVDNIDELINQIQHSIADPDMFSSERERGRDLYFDYQDGNSSERITEMLLSKYDLSE